jgi:hypothetical protein
LKRFSALRRRPPRPLGQSAAAFFLAHS